MLKMTIDLTHDQCVRLADLQAAILKMHEDDEDGIMLAQVLPLDREMVVAVVEHDVAMKIIDLTWSPVL